VAQSVWWIASVIGLTIGLVTHIDNSRIRSETGQAPLKDKQSSLGTELASALQEHLEARTEVSSVHPDRIPQIDNTVDNTYEVESSELE